MKHNDCNSVERGKSLHVTLAKGVPTFPIKGALTGSQLTSNCDLLSVQICREGTECSLPHFPQSNFFDIYWGVPNMLEHRLANFRGWIISTHTNTNYSPGLFIHLLMKTISSMIHSFTLTFCSEWFLFVWCYFGHVQWIRAVCQGR